MGSVQRSSRDAEYRNRLLPVFIAASATGFVTLARTAEAPWTQWTYLAHVLLGTALGLLLLGYLGVHVRRALGLRRLVVSTLGAVTTTALILLCITGFHVTLFGQLEARRIVYQGHLYSAYAGVGLVLLHGLGAGWKSTAAANGGYRRVWFNSGLYLLALAAAIGSASLLYSLSQPGESNKPAIEPYQYSYGDHPFRPSQTETAGGTFLEPARLGNSAACGACHRDIALQWQASMHAQAASDQSYQRNVKLLAEKKGMATTRYCEGCHAPVALLSGQLSDGGRLDTPGHMHEGVACLTCHGIDQVLHVKGVASFRFAPNTEYLFERSAGLLPQKLHNFLLRIQPTQHRADMARSPLATPQLCATCHVQFMDKDVNRWGWVQMQDEYSAWLGSPYSMQSRQQFAGFQVQRCQDCHFPLVEGEDPSGDANGMIRSHFSLGANTAIPYFTGNEQQLRRTRDFLQADKVRLSIEIPDRRDAVRSNTYVAPQISEVSEVPDYLYLDEPLNFNVIVTNAGVGHNFPGGTIDINEVWLDVLLVDGQNRRIYQSGALEASGDVDPAAYFYRSIPIDRKGQHVWRHDLFNMVGDSFKRVIPAGRSDTVSYSVPVPAWAKTPININATLRYRKFTNRYARWALEDGTIQLPIVNVASDALSIPLKLKSVIEQEGSAKLPDAAVIRGSD